MNLGKKLSHYEVLEVTPDATPQEIREAYLRLKTAYGRESLALYTLLTTEETEEMRQQVEEAYLTLSDPEKRRDYDRNHGLLSLEEEHLTAKNFDFSWPEDRSAPMDIANSHEELLIAPATDSHLEENGAISAESPMENRTQPAFTRPGGANPPAERKLPKPDPHFLRDLETEREWHGKLLRKVREAYEISLDEMAEFTKISKNYIRAIESEDYPKLPAAVYLRGFIIQISKRLKLPSEKVASAYIERFRKSVQEN